MTAANPPSTPIAGSKSAALARVLDLVAKGYTRFVAGHVPATKAKALAQKFHRKYGIGCSPAQRLTRKQRGMANAALVMFWPPALVTMEATAQDASQLPDQLSEPSPGQLPDQATAEVTVSWLLLVSPGDGAVAAEEALVSVGERPRLVWLGYELVRLPKRGASSWTWRRTKQEMADLYALLGHQLAARQTAAVAHTLLRISRQPGFSGVRQQSKELMQFSRHRGYTGELPFLFYVQKMKHGPRLWLE